MIVTTRWRGWRWAVAASGGFILAGRSAAADGEVVWSWRRDPGVKPMERSIGDGGKKGRSPGRARKKPQNLRTGKAGMFRLNL